MVLAPIAALSMMNATRFEQRAKDWRLGPVVYQVFVDRFAPSASLDKKTALYAGARKLRSWSDLPGPGRKLDKEGVWSHELEFWGGDLVSLKSKLSHITKLGADVLYTTPVFASLTNHKYDAQDYFKIAPEFGSEKDLKGLVDQAHRSGLKVVLDGVFNHMGQTAPMFQKALARPTDPKRDWFFFGPEYKGGYRAWAGAANLPALRVENPAVRNWLWKDRESVVRHWLRWGIDGWRLDVAFELGPTFLTELTQSAHLEKAGSLVVGEINGYPSDWFPAVDGVFNFFAPNAVMEALRGNVKGGQVGRMLQDMVDDAGIENILRSWLHLDNHDTPRVANLIPDAKARAVAWAALFTLPGSPVVYYGSELGLEGSGDPMNRAPMPWDRATKDNAEYSLVQKLIRIRKQTPSLRYGDFQSLATDRLIAYVRTGASVRDLALVILNPTDEPVKETFSTRVGRLISWGPLKDAISGEQLRQITGLMTVTVPPKTARIFRPVIEQWSGYSPYDRLP